MQKCWLYQKFDYIERENIKEYNPNWQKIPYHPYRVLIIGSWGSGKEIALLNLINCHQDTDKVYR